jgi:hypothetical protein
MGGVAADEECLFNADSSSGKDGGKGGAATVHGTMPNQALSACGGWSIWDIDRKPPKIGDFR